MELRNYWKVFQRRWLLIVIPAVIALAFGLATYRPAPPMYNVGVRYMVSQPPAPAAASEDEERYYNWLTSEYIVNGLTDWVAGNRFKTAVSAELAQNGVDVPAGAIGVAAANVRSQLELSVSFNDPDTLRAIIDAITTVLTEQNADALPQLGGKTAVVVPNDDPVINQIPGGIRSQLDLPLRVAVALLAGIGLALLVEYLDPTVRERAELDAIGLPILGEIPKK